ncbi:heterokaryon incompatibility protein-domain-containing protein [Zalerion maritima]|uniref:Heterokaryon incompatibility protein-domain-containing protein n=1 Tax=Zalerion maritima TaxID=339359 RepID=A0AAD5WQ17_9PEZI|nr:heterokaryon incompatibility protein-domain-containing protein [Zalerion maritima]
MADDAQSHDSKGAHDVIAAAVSTVLIAAITVGLRFYTRWGILRIVGIEDWLILLSLLFSILNTVGMSFQANTALGTHIYDLSGEDIIAFSKQSYFTILAYNASLSFTKLSIMCLYLRIISVLYLRKACYVVLAIVIAASLWSVIGSVFSCVPVAKYWDPTIEGGCLPKGVQWFAAAGLNIGTDFLILSLPLPVIHKLVLHKAQKIVLYFTFALGFLQVPPHLHPFDICIVSILRIKSLLVAADSTDPSYENVGIAIWSTLELNVAIFCACLTTLKPLATRWFPRIFTSSSNSRSYMHHGTTTDGRGPSTTATATASGKRATRTLNGTVTTHDVYCAGGAGKADSDTEILGSSESERQFEMQDLESQCSSGKVDVNGRDIVVTHAITVSRRDVEETSWDGKQNSETAMAACEDNTGFGGAENYFQTRLQVLTGADHTAPQTAFTSKSPHRCSYCEDLSLAFPAASYGYLPYTTAEIILGLEEAVEAAQFGCHFHEWILDIICRDMISNARSPHDTLSLFHPWKAVTIAVKFELESVNWTASLTPHAHGQVQERREKWNAERIMQRPNEAAFLQHQYQAARSPYYLGVTPRVGDATSSRDMGADRLLMWNDPGRQHLNKGFSCLAKTLPIEWDTGSQESMRFAAERLRACLRNHHQCRPLSPRKSNGHGHSAYPSRLVDLKGTRDTGVIHVAETRNLFPLDDDYSGTVPSKVHPCYATLSYCWGGPQSIVLTRDNCECLEREGIAVSRLGATIQDAIWVCIKLDIDYIWVDALCILQDNFIEQHREISQMASYYQNSIVTLCAASAPSSAHGFLTPQSDSTSASPSAPPSGSEPPSAYRAGPFSMKIMEMPRTLPTHGGGMDEPRRRLLSNDIVKQARCLAGATSYIQLLSLNDSNNRPQEPISLRGWTLQEALMSTRLLIFSSRQLYWCCRETYVACGGPDGFDKSHVIRPDCSGGNCVCGVSLVHKYPNVDRVAGIFTLGQLNTSSTDSQWELAVSGYSRRTLSEATDKLKAFSGVASILGGQFRARWPDVKYVAGLWFTPEVPRSFFRQLMWTSETPKTATRPSDTAYRAPTWSWASIDGSVRHFHRAVEAFYYNNPTPSVEEVSVQLISETSPFGEISGATVTMMGKVTPYPRNLVQISLEGSGGDKDQMREIIREQNLWGKRPPFDDEIVVVPDTARDAERLEETETAFCLLEIYPHRPSIRLDSLKGLVLSVGRESQGGNGVACKRLGTFSCHAQSKHAETLFENCTRERLVIE